MNGKVMNLYKVRSRPCGLVRAVITLAILALSACGGENPLSPPPTSDANTNPPDSCSADHPFVGRTVQLSSLAHGVSGTVTVADDCTLVVDNFNYDGGGPAVYFYGGQNMSYIGADAFSIGPRLNGRSWQNETLTLVIPEGKSLDEFDSVSVWCFDFNANFGDAFFGNL